MVNAPTPDAWAPSKFPKSIRGYSPSPVDEAIAAAVERIEELTVENQRLSERVQDLEDRLSVHEERAVATQEALITARTVRQETLEAAEAEAEELRARARDEGARILNKAGELKREAEADVDELRRTTEAEAQAEADRIRGEARAEAERRLQLADREIAALAAQLERLEERRTEFVDFVTRELGDGKPLKRMRSRRKSQPLDIRFRRPGEGLSSPSMEVSLDG